MHITQVRVFPVEEDKLKAFVSIVIDGCFVVSDIKIIEGTNGLFISMPSKKRKNGTFRDIAHPLNNETRRHLEERIVEEYREVMAAGGGDAEIPVRALDADSRDGDSPDPVGGHVRDPEDVGTGSSDVADRPDPADLEDGRPSWP